LSCGVALLAYLQLHFAVQHDLLVRNTAESLGIPPDRQGKKRNPISDVLTAMMTPSNAVN